MSNSRTNDSHWVVATAHLVNISARCSVVRTYLIGIERSKLVL